jgi:hypothetical protein
VKKRLLVIVVLVLVVAVVGFVILRPDEPARPYKNDNTGCTGDWCY